MLKRFSSANKGLAAIEFAILLPLLVLGFFGATEVSSAVQAAQKTSQTSSTVADLVAQASTITNADLTNIYAAANAITFPYAVNGETIVITSLTDNGNNTGKVAWSAAQNGTPHTVGQVLSVPFGVMPASGSVILAEVSFNFQPPTSYVITGAITMNSQFYSRPRRVAVITRS